MSDEKQSALITVGANGALTPQNFEGAYRMAQIMAASGMMPKGMDRVESVFVAIQMGMEVGLSPMAAVQNIAVVNGRPTIWGDAMLGLVKGSGLLAGISESISGEGEAATAACTVTRRGETGETVGRFSVADAKRAGLWGKAGPWTQYPRRMLQMRARAFALRDCFPDILKGLYCREELAGEVYGGVAEQVTPTASLAALAPRAKAHEPPDPGPTYADVAGWLTDAESRDELDLAMDRARDMGITGPDMDRLDLIYAERSEELGGTA